MKKTILSLIMCIIIVFGASVSVSAEPDLTLDFNKRYTDISEVGEIDDPFLETNKNSQEKEQKRNIYVIILSVCLVVAIGVFVYTLRKVPDEKSLQEKGQVNSDVNGIAESKINNLAVKDALKDEEKKL